MTADREAARTRALAMCLLLDPEAIRRRVHGGDAVFAQRVLLTALIKGSEEPRARVTTEVGEEHFFSLVFGVLFKLVSQSLDATGQVDESALYEQMEARVRKHWTSESDPSYDGSQYSAEQVMPGYLSPIDHVLAIEMPDDDTIDHAIASLQRYRRWRSGLNGKRDASSVDDNS